MALVDPLKVSRAMKVRALVAATLVSAVAACSPDKQQSAAVTPQSPAVTRSGTQDQASLVFFDADVFDLSFADEMKLGTDQIHITFAGPTSLNAFPPRMNTWLAEVRKSDGRISVVDPNHPGGTRGIFGIGMIFDVIDAINTMQARKALAERLALADAYNAKIVYDSTSGIAREVVFTRRPPAGGDISAGGAVVASPDPAGTQK